MLKESAQWNARMRQQTPEGFELDETHRPHITILQRHIRQADLEKVLATVDQVRESIDLRDFQMTATGLYHIPAGDIGLAGITVEPSEQLLALQQAIVEAVAPYDHGAGDESAYVPDPTGTPFNPMLFEYVETFVPEQTGRNFNPHVTIGIAPRPWLEDLEDKPFEAFTFEAAALAVYQLGNFGTAARRLTQD